MADGSHDFSESGISLLLDDGSHTHVWLDLHSVIADESALHALYGCRGPGGIRCCMLCANIYNILYKARSIVENDRRKIARYSTTSDFDAIVLHTSESISAVIDRLAGLKGRLSNADFEEVEKLQGWNYKPDGAMWDPEFRKRIDPPSKATLDGMHIYFVKGVFNGAAGQLIRHSKDNGIRLSELEAYAKLWQLPRPHAEKTGIAAAFPSGRLNSLLQAKTFEVAASEGLGIYPILGQYCSSKLGHAIAPHCICFLTLCRVISLWLRRTPP